MVVHTFNDKQNFTEQKKKLEILCLQIVNEQCNDTKLNQN